MTAPARARELDQPVWHALSGPHRALSVSHGGAARYRPTVAPFAALPPVASAQDWGDLTAVAGDDPLVLFGLAREVPAGWDLLGQFDVVQMTAPTGFGRRHPDIERLTEADVPAMVDLVAEARPGPFSVETYRCGAYYGIKEDGRLVAMAGERLTTPSWTEISAVATRASHRGRGLATRLMEVVAHGIREAGRSPFLHTGATNAGAIRLYEHLGFTVRDTANVVQRVRRAGVDAPVPPLH
ncbi:GNAT family N-acetyltransferase [Demequina lignilytica]|uniref:GNAT family N-acetyltransferase n=1 Tax=Demequina lignilytica TaxID=3051663 RepID=A0AB35MGS8_9MICO|nr:GNAT family N-acetyltransferase [Demequina sp. SYSU T0a273]MDN4482925.1 GNAT family N-acetyltransferase [Demequina sp. SYSU T0a273]